MACLAERRPFTAPNNLHDATELLSFRSAMTARQPVRAPLKQSGRSAALRYSRC